MEKLVKTQVDTKLNTPSKITSTHCANKRKFVPYSDIKELCIFSLSYYGDDIELRSWKKIPMMYVHICSMYDWKIPSYTYEEKGKIAAAQRIIQFSLFWGRHIGLVLHAGWHVHVISVSWHADVTLNCLRKQPRKSSDESSFLVSLEGAERQQWERGDFCSNSIFTHYLWSTGIPRFPRFRFPRFSIYRGL